MNTGTPATGAALAGKVVLVTGGSKGIGYAVARAVTRQGATAAITGRDANDLDRARAEIGGGTVALRADVRDAASAQRAIDEAAAKLGGLDVLINNAGIATFANVADLSVEDFDAMIATNLSGVFYCCRAALPHLRRRGGGYIINISSLAGKNAFAGGAAYCASKAGLNQFSEALMQEVRQDDIRVTYLMPGSVATGFGGRSAPDTAAWKIQPDDVGQIVVDLLLMPARSLPSRVELRPSKPPK